MHAKRPVSLIVVALLALAACGEDPPAKDASNANNAAAHSDAPKKGSGDDSKASDSDKKGADTKADSDKKESKGSGGGGGGKSEISCKGEPKVGKNASPFSLSSINGGGKTGVEKGKVTIVDFWATWCEPCKKSFPKYQELYVKYKASGLEIVAVSVDDDKKDIPDFIKTHGAKFPVGWDEGHKIAECYKPPSMPSAYVIDKNGNIKHVHTGYHDGEEKELEKEIKSLL
jgi:cytochrome c biogenesis protein CcmG, thiol:disulfide interchange protein DsbE